MAKYIKFSEMEIDQANRIDIKSLLEKNGERLKRSGIAWEWKHQGKKISICENKWFDQYERIGGRAIKFVMIFYNKSFQEAVLQLLHEECGRIVEAEVQESKEKIFILPEANSNMKRVYAYLIKKRFIDRNILSYFINIKLLYEDSKYHNAIFVGRDENGIPRHAHKVGTISKGEHFRANQCGSDARYSFHYIGKSNRLYIFEAPIDMLAYITLNPIGWKQHSYVALCGVAADAAKHIIETYPYIHNAIFCLDNDEPGNAAYNRMKNLLGCEITRQKSKNKDWDEDLKEKNGVLPIPAQDNMAEVML